MVAVGDGQRNLAHVTLLINRLHIFHLATIPPKAKPFGGPKGPLVHGG